MMEYSLLGLILLGEKRDLLYFGSDGLGVRYGLVDGGGGFGVGIC